MTTEHESISEEIIQIHIRNNGLYNWRGFHVSFENTSSNDRMLVKKALIEKGIISDYYETETRLTEVGWNFKSFDDERQNKLLEKQRLERKDKSDELDLLIKSWQVKTKYLPYIVSFSALIGTIISIIISYKALTKPQDQTNLHPMQTEIQELTKRVTRMDSLFRADTLSRKRKK